MKVITTREALRAELATWHGRSIGFVPTMGFLHDGHLSLFRRCAADNDVSVASIFVNPKQFGPNEDLDRYPRNPEGDTAAAEAAGIDILWMPPDGSVYAPGHATTVHVDGITRGLCGDSRPVFFDGIATVVTKLFNIVQPTRTYFGEKDWQQLAMVRRMAHDLDMPVEVIGMPIVREPDGLAMSSRNAYLRPDARQDALALSRALVAARRAWVAGERDVDALIAILRAPLEAAERVVIDYVEVVDPETIAYLRGTRLDTDAPALAAIAVDLQGTRLIDNARLDLPSPLEAVHP